jgi:hypothetical protein
MAPGLNVPLLKDPLATALHPKADRVLMAALQVTSYGCYNSSVVSSVRKAEAGSMSPPFSQLQPILILVLLAAERPKRLRGGKKVRRDNWFGLETKADFPPFKRWWHREGKDAAGGSDLTSAKEAQEAYDEWVAQGRPTAK